MLLKEHIQKLACWQADGLAISAEDFQFEVIETSSEQLHASLTLPFACYSLHSVIREELQGILTQIQPGIRLDLQISTKIPLHLVQHGLTPRLGIKNIIAVASGKGGVGKSSTAINLALALHAEGAQVGLLDADIYGPSQPMMLGITSSPESKDGKTLQPIERYGLQTMSIGYLIDQDTAMIWRGPMVSTALQQLFNDTQWQNLDYLVVDLPPGTGDIQLTLSQKIPVAGALIVTTPQDIALLDAKKAVAMFTKVNVPVLGIVENMSTYICSCCGHQEAIFGENGALKMADDYGLPLFGQIPLAKYLREDLDNGAPTVMQRPEDTISQLYRQIARRLSVSLAKQAKQPISKFPRIVIE